MNVVDGAPVAVEPVGFPDAGAGMIRTSIQDFMRFIATCANGGSAHHTRILQADTMSQMIEMKTPASLPEWLTGQGLGWMASKLEGVPTPEHFGGDPGVFTAVYAEPATRSGVAVFTNTSATAASKAAVKAIASRLLLVHREPFS
ncbi:MAG: serine hydrolase [Gammaproteobacteria bacterium]